MIKKILFPFYNKERHWFLMNKGFFRLILSIFILVICCCLVFIPIDNYNSYSTRNKLEKRFSDYLEHLTANGWRIVLSIWWVEQDWIEILTDAWVLRVFWIYCTDYFCVYQSYKDDKVTNNYSMILKNGWRDPKSVENISQFSNRGTSLLKRSDFNETALQKYKNSYINALDKFDWIILWFNEKLANEEFTSASSKNAYRDSIFSEMVSNKKEWKSFKIKTRTIAIVKPIVITLVIFYVVQLIFLLRLIDFIILWWKNDDKGVWNKKDKNEWIKRTLSIKYETKKTPKNKAKKK